MWYFKWGTLSNGENFHSLSSPYLLQPFVSPWGTRIKLIEGPWNINTVHTAKLTSKILSQHSNIGHVVFKKKYILHSPLVTNVSM